MPIYEYKCSKCDREFEELIFGDEVPACPACGEAHTERMLSCATLHMPAPSRVGQTVTFPSNGKNACRSCSSTNCSSCGK